MPDCASAQARFADLADALVGGEGVTLGSGRRGFGSGALQVDGHIFAMLNDDRLVLKLPAGRVNQLLASGDGVAFDAGKGRPMKEWVVLEHRTDDRWLPLAREALTFVPKGDKNAG
jgi:hypothetical protein